MGREYPPGPRDWCFGLALGQRLRTDTLGMFTDVARNYGDLACFRLGPYRIYSVNHPALVRKVLVQEDVDIARELYLSVLIDGSVSGAFLRVDAQAEPVLYDALKRMPAVAGVGSRLASLASFEQTLARSLGISTFILIVFACTIACAVVYNAARIVLSERGRELASLRVLGFSRAEVTRMLLGEQALLTLLAAPLGLFLGTEICALVARAYQWELFRLPGSVSARTYAFALFVVTLAALSSAWLVKRRLDHLDLVQVLKARE